MFIKQIWDLPTLSRPLFQISLGLWRPNYTVAMFHTVYSGLSEIPVSSVLKNENSPSWKMSCLLVFHNMPGTVSSALGTKWRAFWQGSIMSGASYSLYVILLLFHMWVCMLCITMLEVAGNTNNWNWLEWERNFIGSQNGSFPL